MKGDQMEDEILEPTEVTYQIKKPFEYAWKGNTNLASFITLTPPTMRNHSLAAPLKQSISRIVSAAVEKARSSQTENEQNEDSFSDENSSEEITAQMVLNSIYTSQVVNVNTVWEQAKKLICDGVALIGGELKFNQQLINKMSPIDFEQMVGLYIANFILV